jgi:hypothetical protein
MRIDVAPAHRDIDAELARLHERMNTPGDALHGMSTFPAGLPDLVFRYREVAGEFYVYVEDVAKGALAGCTVFNRALEVERKAERYLRSPHSRYGSGYQRRGLATAVYSWALQAGLCLISGPRQSVGAHSLWRSLGTAHELLFVQVRDKKLQCLGPRLDGSALDEFDTRMLLLGAGWNLDRFAKVANCRLPGTPGALENPAAYPRAPATQPSPTGVNTLLPLAAGGP